MEQKKIENQWAFTIKDFLNPTPFSLPGFYIQRKGEGGEGGGGGGGEGRGKNVVPFEELMLFRKNVLVYIVRLLLLLLLLLFFFFFFF